MALWAVLLRLEGPKAGWGFWTGGSQPLPHQLGVWGSAVSSANGVRGRSSAAKRFCLYLNAPYSLSCHNSCRVDTL